MDKLEPDLADTIAESITKSWVGGAAESLVQSPPTVTGDRPPSPPDVPSGIDLLQPDEGPQRIRLPEIEKAAERLATARIVTPEEFYELGAAARTSAFTISADLKVEAVGQIRQLLARNVFEGADREKFIADVDALFARGTPDDIPGTFPLTEAHVEQIFRNNVNGQWSEGQHYALESPLVVDAFPYRAYSATEDSRVRDEHLALETMGLMGENGKRTNIYNKDDPVWLMFRPPWSWNSIAAESDVQGRIMYGLESRYSGKVLKLTTESGRRLTVSPNHPILTANGFVAAKHLGVGENLLRYHGPTNADALGPLDDVDDLPVTARDLFDSLLSFTGSIPVETTGLDLHGDAAGGDGQVNVVAANRELLDYVKAAISQSDIAGRFTGADLNALFLARQGAAMQLGQAGRATATGFPGRGQVPGHPVSLDSQFCRVGLAANLDISRHETASNGCPADSNLFGQLQFRFSGEISIDKLVYIQVEHFSGSMYDFQTDIGYMVANGIVVSNCRCSWRPVTLLGAARAGVIEAKEWLERARALVKQNGIELEVAVQQARPTRFEFVNPPNFLPPPEWRRELVA